MCRASPLALCCVFALFLQTYAATVAAEFPSPNYTELHQEAVTILRDLIRINTSSPPGNETQAAEYLQALLANEGIESKILGADPKRGNLVARLKGDGSKRPILIMGHTDVVGAQPKQWTMDPFAAEIRDGFIYGRGAVDDKDTVTAGLLTLLTLKRLNIPLERDVIFLAEASEEGGANIYGIGYMIRERWQDIDAEFALAEGGSMPTSGGKVRYVGVATTEKRIARMSLIARGTSGHGSVPLDDNAVVDLAAAVAKIGRYQMPTRFTETTQAFFERLATISSPEHARVYRALLNPKTRIDALDDLRRINPAYDSTLRTSLSPTTLKAGIRYNVIPGEAEATIDVRMLQDEDLSAVTETLRQLIDNPRVEISSRDGGRPKGAPSPLNTDLFRALEQTQAAMFPEAITLPKMLTGATDMAQLRAQGVKAYGIGGPLLEGGSRAHANDERIGVEALGTFVEFVYRTVVEVAAKK